MRTTPVPGAVQRSDPPGPPPLASTPDQVRQWASDRSIPCLPGHVTADGSLPRVVIGRRDAPSLQQVLGWLESCQAALVAIRVTTFTRDQWQELQDRCVGRDVDPDLVRHLAELEEVIDETGSVQITAIIGRPAALVVYDQWADWYHIVAEADELAPLPTDPEELAALAEYEARVAERERWNPAAVESAARLLIEDERWPQARKEDAQLYVAEQILGADMPAILAIRQLIVRRAKTLYEFTRPKSRGAKPGPRKG